MNNNAELRLQVKLLKARDIISRYYELAELMEIPEKSFYNWISGCYDFGYVKQERLQDIINNLS